MSADTHTQPQIESVSPPAAISGGLLELRGKGLAARAGEQPVVHFGGARGRLIVGGPRRAVVAVPRGAADDSLTVEAGEAASDPYPCSLGLVLAENMHPVASPAVDAQGNVFTTRSGSRGEKLPVSVFKIDVSGDVKPFISDIVNPTGLVFLADGRLLISSRHNGAIYAVTPDSQMEIYAEGMGVATGLAVDREENVYVGDRTGTVFKISPSRRIYVFATLEPSVAAFHLAYGPDDNLYVSGPTTSSSQRIHRVDPEGRVTRFSRGFGRPQGLAFDAAGRLHLCASYRGSYGVFRLNGGDSVEQIVSGPGIVGLAFTRDEDMIVTTTSEVYKIAAAGRL